MSSNFTGRKLYLCIYMSATVLGVILGHSSRDEIMIRVYSEIVHCELSHLAVGFAMLAISFLGFYGTIAEKWSIIDMFAILQIIFLFIRVYATVKIFLDIQFFNPALSPAPTFLLYFGEPDPYNVKKMTILVAGAYLLACILTVAAIEAAVSLTRSIRNNRLIIVDDLGGIPVGIITPTLE